MYVLDAKDLIIKVWMEVYACIVWIFFPHMCLEIWQVGEFEWLGILINDISWHIFEITVLERRNKKTGGRIFCPRWTCTQQRMRKKCFLQWIPFFFLHLSLPSKVHTFQKKNFVTTLRLVCYIPILQSLHSVDHPFQKETHNGDKIFLGDVTQRNIFKFYQIL